MIAIERLRADNPPSISTSQPMVLLNENLQLLRPVHSHELELMTLCGGRIKFLLKQLLNRLLITPVNN